MARLGTQIVGLACLCVAGWGCESQVERGLEGLACDERQRCTAGYVCQASICVRKFTASGASDTATRESTDGQERNEGGLPWNNDAAADALTTSPQLPAPATQPVASVEPSVSPDASPQSAADEDAGPPPPAECAPMGAPQTPSICPSVCDGGCDAGVCRIKCAGNSRCAERMLECPAQLGCELECSGPQACEDVVVVASDEFATRVTCSGAQTCVHLTLICQGDGACALDCAGGTDGCLGASVQCGRGPCQADCASTSQPLPGIECANACDCSGC